MISIHNKNFDSLSLHFLELKQELFNPNLLKFEDNIVKLKIDIIDVFTKIKEIYTKVNKDKELKFSFYSLILVKTANELSSLNLNNQTLAYNFEKSWTLDFSHSFEFYGLKSQFYKEYTWNLSKAFGHLFEVQILNDTTLSIKLSLSIETEIKKYRSMGYPSYNLKIVNKSIGEEYCEDDICGMILYYIQESNSSIKNIGK